MSFGGFSTGGGKKLKISDEQMKMAKQRMGEAAPTKSKPETKEPKTTFSGFSTGGGKKMSISEEQMNKANQRMGEAIPNPTNHLTHKPQAKEEPQLPIDQP